ncbi:uncharacterized protein Z518_08915 [Rhinocladiella mackenziei CBS 650.93]|uniref:Protein kinase domain-containing protein n=1 Tax=Rhinocladiella mackenziei CBS 650.93 TaxID=1442369 RepID=A0A0D2IX55_9EURO|nr:uncharacterized protein Z518_08915 [Rhinocladiella mackenziei CBS 650.93]KIX01190.1 hypothetical protein Z518_08915 [Rhinocladiella mackenziei CBS 650.93]
MEVGELGKGSFGKVSKAVDLDSGCFIPIEKIPVPPKVNCAVSNEEIQLRREVKILSSISHPGNLSHLLEKSPSVHTNDKVLMRLEQEMLEALDYLAFRGWIHRDVELEGPSPLYSAGTCARRVCTA